MSASTPLINLSVVVPVYNEEEVLPQFYSQLKQVLTENQYEHEIIFVDDGSTDRSKQVIEELAAKDVCVKLILLSRNFGQQMATTAGLDHALGDVVVMLDADLQDPPELIPQMVKEWKLGYDVVYGRRIKREGENFFKRASSKIFYRVLQLLTKEHMPLDTGDFRLMDRKVILMIRHLRERNRFVRGIVSWLGFRQKEVCFERQQRSAGKTKYSFRKLIYIAVDAIVSFSVRPLRVATVTGLIVSTASFFLMVYVLYEKLFTDHIVQGWASLIGVSLFLNGAILMFLGIMGEYVGRIYAESKQRPLYVIEETIGLDVDFRESLRESIERKIPPYALKRD